ncbi:MAG TPA: hypothetical protein VF479_08065, partial [Pseudolysinimonas sp.]
MSDNETWQAPGAGSVPPGPTSPSTPPSAAAQPAPPSPSAGYYLSAPPAPGAPLGWTPPPKPGLIPLRPLTLGPILAASFQVMRRNPRATLGPALILSVILAVVTALGLTAYVGALTRVTYAANPDDAETLLAGSAAVALALVLLGGGAIAVATAVLQAIIVTEVARGTVGEKLRLGQILGRIRGRIGAVIGYTVLVIVAAAVAVAIFFGIIVAITTLAVSSGPSSGGDYGALLGAMLATVGLTLLGYLGALVIA